MNDALTKVQRTKAVNDWLRTNWAPLGLANMKFENGMDGVATEALGFRVSSTVLMYAATRLGLHRPVGQIERQALDEYLRELPSGECAVTLARLAERCTHDLGFRVSQSVLCASAKRVGVRIGTKSPDQIQPRIKFEPELDARVERLEKAVRSLCSQLGVPNLV